MGDGVEMASLQSWHQLGIIGGKSMSEGGIDQVVSRFGEMGVSCHISRLETFVVLPRMRRLIAGSIGARIIEALRVRDLFVHEYFCHGTINVDVHFQSIADRLNSTGMTTPSSDI